MTKVKNRILNSIKPVVKSSKFVSINQNKILSLAKKLFSIPFPKWDSVEFKGTDYQIAQYCFFLDSINFCFWNIPESKRWYIKKGKEWIKGYYALSEAIKKAAEENLNLLDAKYLKGISFKEFKKIFQGKGELLLLPERHKIIQENFKILGEKFDGQVVNIVKQARGNVNIFVNLILNSFSNYNDVSIHNNCRVLFLKRVQLLASDLYQSLKHLDLRSFKNMDDLAVFMDYKIPQLLQAERVLIYSDNLLKKISSETLIDQGSIEEIEIRANAIWACELILKELTKLGRKINSNDLDWILWILSKQTDFPLPYHKTLTIFY